jgi:hypothetical protein
MWILYFVYFDRLAFVAGLHGNKVTLNLAVASSKETNRAINGINHRGCVGHCVDYHSAAIDDTPVVLFGTPHDPRCATVAATIQVWQPNQTDWPESYQNDA